jgi:hypothetical protein
MWNFLPVTGKKAEVREAVRGKKIVPGTSYNVLRYGFGGQIFPKVASLAAMAEEAF